MNDKQVKKKTLKDRIKMLMDKNKQIDKVLFIVFPFIKVKIVYVKCSTSKKHCKKPNICFQYTSRQFN